MTIESESAEVAALVDAMWQVLDDLGITGTFVTLSTKAQARVALEPFLMEGEEEDMIPLDDAMDILREE